VGNCFGFNGRQPVINKIKTSFSWDQAGNEFLISPRKSFPS
jgi:hypothetical protein